MKLFKQNLIWTRTVEEKTLRPYNGKVIISENGEEGEENNKE